MTRAMRRYHDGIGTCPAELQMTKKEKMVKSRKVVCAENMYQCEKRWKDGSRCGHDEVHLTKDNCKKRKGRTGVVWGNIRSGDQTSTIHEFKPNVWWLHEQVWEWHPTIGPFVQWPIPVRDKARTWDERT